MLGVLANDHDAALALDDLALFADGLDRRPDFHANILLLSPRYTAGGGIGFQPLDRQVMRPRVRS